jgi:hypothetical protein
MDFRKVTPDTINYVVELFHSVVNYVTTELIIWLSA